MCISWAIHCFGVSYHDDYYFTPQRPPIPYAHTIERVSSLLVDYKFIEAISSIDIALKSISALLEPPRRSITDDHVRHCLAFMRMELRAVAVSLRSASSSSSDPIWPPWWPGALLDASLWVSNVYSMYDIGQCHALLQKAARHCRCPRPASQRLLEAIEITDATFRSYRIFQDPCRYKEHYTRPCSDLGLPNVEVEGGFLVGIHGPAKKLLQWIMAADKSQRVISIVGPAGMGKTTLAMELYHQLRSQTGGTNQFQCYARAQMSRVPDIKEVLHHILKQVSRTGTPMLLGDYEPEQLVRCVSLYLHDQRYFIVIDDIWKLSDWDQIKDAFPRNNLGSRVVITTCFTSIAWSCSSGYGGHVHEMKPLNVSDSKMLLHAKTFGYVADDHRVLETSVKVVCDEILRRCEGIPLFITGMAGWLKKEKSFALKEEKSFAFDSVEQVPKLLKHFGQALSPTYEDLPYDLRLLLLFISMFPHGYTFNKDSLIRKWLLYEGLTGRKYMDIKEEDEEEAEMYFSQLVDRNIITRVAANWGHNPDEAEDCRWHVSHCMLQFVAHISAEKGFSLTSSTLTSTAAPEPGGGDKTPAPRRLALHHSNPELAAVLQTMDLSHTRTLVVSGVVEQILYDKFTYLIILDLEGWENLKDEDMQQICSSKMCLLVHLSIRRTRVSKLPRQIKELCNLRTLDISHTQISELPLEVYMLQYLWMLDLRSTLIMKLPEHDNSKWRLEHILVGHETIISSSTETAAKIPERILLSGNLKTLATIDLSKHSPSLVESLGNHAHLRVLAMTWSYHQCTEGGYRDSLLSSIKKWKNLKSLTIHCGLGCSMEFMDALSAPPQKLEKFKVTAGRFASVPKWIGMLNSLSFLQITVCRLGTEDLKILKDLSKLQCLVLGLEFIPREEIMIESEGFNELIRLSVDCPVPWLSFKDGAMRRLAYLELQICSGPKRRGAVPSGICNLENLSEIVLRYNQTWFTDGSHVKKTVEVVRNEVAKHCNQIDFIINGTKIDDVQMFNETEWQTKIQNDTGGEANGNVQAVIRKTLRTTTQIQYDIEAEADIKST